MLYAVLANYTDGCTFSCNNCLEGVFSSYEKAEEYVLAFIKDYPKAKLFEGKTDEWMLDGFGEDNIVIDLIEVDKPIND